MFDKYVRRLENLVKATLQSPGDTPVTLRQSIFDRGQAQSVGAEHIDPVAPSGLTEFIDKIAYMPYEVRDSDLASLATQGYSDDAVLEIINTASLAAGLGRMEIVKAAMRGERNLS